MEGILWLEMNEILSSIYKLILSYGLIMIIVFLLFIIMSSPDSPFEIKLFHLKNQIFPVSCELLRTW